MNQQVKDTLLNADLPGEYRISDYGSEGWAVHYNGYTVGKLPDDSLILIRDSGTPREATIAEVAVFDSHGKSPGLKPTFYAEAALGMLRGLTR